MKSAYFMSALIVVLSFSFSVFANHPGDNLDEVMGKKEKYFQAIDKPSAPGFSLMNVEGESKSLSDFSDKIVVLNFIFTNCAGVCPLHSALIKDIQDNVNATPMRDMVQFISITTDPAYDRGDVLKEYGELHELDPINLTFLTTKPNDPDDMTRKLAEEYGVKFQPDDSGQQMHGVVTFIIDRGGRFAAKFHGLRAKPLNVVLYLNGLSNNEGQSHEKGSDSWWEKIKSVF